MLPELVHQYSSQIESLSVLLMLINAILHLIFAGGVARDAGNNDKLGHKPALVSGATWAFATLLGGVMIAAIYWFIHHSTITRPITQREPL